MRGASVDMRLAASRRRRRKRLALPSQPCSRMCKLRATEDLAIPRDAILGIDRLCGLSRKALARGDDAQVPRSHPRSRTSERSASRLVRASLVRFRSAVAAAQPGTPSLAGLSHPVSALFRLDLPSACLSFRSPALKPASLHGSCGGCSQEWLGRSMQA